MTKTITQTITIGNQSTLNNTCHSFCINNNPSNQLPILSILQEIVSCSDKKLLLALR